MSDNREALTKLWLSIDGIAADVAEARDQFLSFPGLNKAYGHLDGTYRHLRTVEDSLHQYLDWQRNAVSQQEINDQIFWMITNAAIENAKLTVSLAVDQLTSQVE
jgi:hypothetical protein